MTVINIAELIGTPNAIIQKFGLQVLEEAVKIIDSGNQVILDFSNLKNTTTGFFHASIGNLYKKYGEDFFQLVNVSSIDKKDDWKEKYEEAINLVKNPQQASEIDFAIAKLFE
ncbi:hypothetical protein FHW88_005203 [Mucilaginibacter sp. SG538B]|uniref:STAS-like domain-containing protein n=1 Tax=Mucilaginibacter sp. SG538B TaxID=2587021 RepID=UPI00159DA55B|nr:STAS-like domain-containing protein [Mucilaginibacter sp. SG538B]NVM66885.1 hypothetical protein [Mucilaginibacter sp. SG538B]